MLQAKKKITKKQIKEDKLVTSYYNFQNFFMENQARLLIAAGVVIVIAVAIFLFMNKKANDNKTASAQLATVIPIFEAGTYQEAIDGKKDGNIVGLKKIVDDFGSSESGETAKIYLADAYYLLGKTEEALETYNDYSGSNDLFKATAIAGQAACKESKNETEDAANLFLEASKISKINPSNADYLLRAGINLIKLNKKAEAKEVFESIKKDYKNSSAAVEVERYLLQIEA